MTALFLHRHALFNGRQAPLSTALQATGVTASHTVTDHATLRGISNKTAS